MALGRKYAKWKAAYIHNCLKSGQTPVAGPLATGEDQEEEHGMDQEQGQFFVRNISLLWVRIHFNRSPPGRTSRRRDRAWTRNKVIFVRNISKAASRARCSGSGSISFSTKCIFVFPDKFNILSKILKNITLMTMIKKSLIFYILPRD